MNAAAYKVDIEREFGRLKDLAERAMAQISDQQFFESFGDESNCIAIIVKHMAGNMKSRWTNFLTTDGEKPDRQRDQEFLLTADDTRAELMGSWERSWSIVLQTIAALDGPDFSRTITIRQEPHTATQAIHRQLTHYAYHVGQIILLAKVLIGEGWRSLSIPKGKSQDFLEKPAEYLSGPK